MNDPSDCIDVYRLRLDLPETEWARYSTILTDTERNRAAAFLSDSKRREFTITRATLRTILARTLDEQPSRINIVHQVQGKPCLAGNDSVCFSVSHSYDCAVIAVGRDRDIGIDVEKIRDDIEHEQLAKRFFSQAEYGALQHCSESNRLRAFFAVWTRKEAVVKAQGAGIALGLKQFDVSIDPDTAPSVIATRWQQSGIPAWTLFNLDVGPDYAACIAVSGGKTRINLREFG